MMTMFLSSINSLNQMILQKVDYVTLRDTANGSDTPGWIVGVILLIVAFVLLSGHGSWMIAGYNTATKEEKKKYDEQRLCRVTGTCMLTLSALIFFTLSFQDQLPAEFAQVLLVLITLIILITIIVMNTWAKKRG